LSSAVAAKRDELLAAAANQTSPPILKIRLEQSVGASSGCPVFFPSALAFIGARPTAIVADPGDASGVIQHLIQ